jgi:cell division protein FtsB
LVVEMAKTSALALRVGLGAAIVYLGAHAITGQQGLAAYVGLQQQQEELRTTLTEVEAERASLEARAARLRPETLDIDYLEERAAVSLGTADRDDMVFQLNPAG